MLVVYASAGRGTCLEEDHGGDLLGGEGLLLAKVLNLDLRVTAIVDDGKGPRLNILLDRGVIEATADQTPRGRGGRVSKPKPLPKGEGRL
jgi:hypothetical protein